MTEFLTMGGYWPFVWPAFILSVIVLGAVAFFSLRDYAEQLRQSARVTSADDASDDVTTVGATGEESPENA